MDQEEHSNDSPDQSGSSPAEVPPEQSKKAQRVVEWLRNNHEPVIAICTALILLVTTAYAVLALLQWTAMRQSNEINRQSLYTVQRAFLTFDGVAQEVVNAHGPASKKPERTIQMHLKWRNVGNTPAVDIFTAIGVAQQQHQEPSEPMFLATGHNIPLNTAPAGPREELDSQDVYLPLSFADTGTSEDDRYVWGWVVYRDMFPRTPEHVTEFCTLITSIEQEAGKEHKVGFGAIVCHNHNCVDDGCQDYDSILKRVANRQGN